MGNLLGRKGLSKKRDERLNGQDHNVIINKLLLCMKWKADFYLQDGNVTRGKILAKLSLGELNLRVLCLRLPWQIIVLCTFFMIHTFQKELHTSDNIVTAKNIKRWQYILYIRVTYKKLTCSTIMVARSRNISLSSDIDCTIDCISFSLCSIKAEFSSASLICSDVKPWKRQKHTTCMWNFKCWQHQITTVIT